MGDNWEHWGDLRTAQMWIIQEVRRRSFCTLICKEKYGTIRYEYVLPPKGRLMGLTKLSFAWNNSWLFRKWQAWGWRILLGVVFEAIYKWPQCKDELLEDLAVNEELVGKKIHDLYWTTVKGEEYE